MYWFLTYILIGSIMSYLMSEIDGGISNLLAVVNVFLWPIHLVIICYLIFFDDDKL